MNLQRISFSLLALAVLPLLAAAETETNNTEATADTLTAGIVMNGNLSSDVDVDFFVLTVSGSDFLEIEFAAPGATASDQWLLLLQRPSDGSIVYQEVFSPSAESAEARTVEISQSGSYFIIIQSAGGANPTPGTAYQLTITPDNFAPAIGGIDGVWQDPVNNVFYSLHESSGGLLLIELSVAPTAWRAFFGSRGDNQASLDLVVGSGSATLQLQFTTPTSYEARYLSCQTATGAACAETPGELLYTANRVFAN